MVEGEFFVDDNSLRFDKLIALHCQDLSRSRIKQLIENGDFLVDGKIVKSGQKLKLGQKVSFSYEEAKPLSVEAEDIDFEIVYEDDDLIVINKPQGLVVHPCSSTKNGTLVNGLLYKIKNLSGINGVLRPGIVHRLDKNTSGLMIVAKNDYAHNLLAKEIEEKQNFSRTYIALCEGHLKNQVGRVETFIARDVKDRKKMAVSTSGKKAITNYNVLKSYEGYDLVEFHLETGRTHQIRVHAKYLNHPIVGDDVYGKAVKGLNGQLLHSYKLSFIHPRTHEKMSFEIDLPQYFKEFLKKLKEITENNWNYPYL